MTVSLEPVHVGTSVAEVVNLLEPLAAQHGVTLQNDVPQDGERHVAGRHAAADAGAAEPRLERDQVQQGERVASASRSSRRRRDRTLILVTDTGQGISEENQAKLFTPFDRLGADETAIEGTGLGLALSKL